MYDRAARDVTQKTGNTLDHVGPGTYDANVVDPKKIRSGKLQITVTVVIHFNKYELNSVAVLLYVGIRDLNYVFNNPRIVVTKL